MKRIVLVSVVAGLLLTACSMSAKLQHKSSPTIEPQDTKVTTLVVERVEPTSYESPMPVASSTPVIQRFDISAEERYIVECVVMGEAGGESYEGQVLVAQCILNGCVKEEMRPSELVEAYSYYGWNSEPSESVQNAVSAVFDDGYKVTEEEVLYFYNPDTCYSEWHESMHYVLTEGNHKFFSDWS